MRLLGHPLYYRPLLVGLSLMLFQQVGDEILRDRETVMRTPLLGLHFRTYTDTRTRMPVRAIVDGLALCTAGDGAGRRDVRIEQDPGASWSGVGPRQVLRIISISAMHDIASPCDTSVSISRADQVVGVFRLVMTIIAAANVDVWYEHNLFACPKLFVCATNAALI